MPTIAKINKMIDSKISLILEIKKDISLSEKGLLKLAEKEARTEDAIILLRKIDQEDMADELVSILVGDNIERDAIKREINSLKDELIHVQSKLLNEIAHAAVIAPVNDPKDEVNIELNSINTPFD